MRGSGSARAVSMASTLGLFPSIAATYRDVPSCGSEGAGGVIVQVEIKGIGFFGATKAKHRLNLVQHRLDTRGLSL